MVKSSDFQWRRLSNSKNEVWRKGRGSLVKNLMIIHVYSGFILLVLITETKQLGVDSGSWDSTTTFTGFILHWFMEEKEMLRLGREFAAVLDMKKEQKRKYTWLFVMSCQLYRQGPFRNRSIFTTQIVMLINIPLKVYSWRAYKILRKCVLTF